MTSIQQIHLSDENVETIDWSYCYISKLEQHSVDMLPKTIKTLKLNNNLIKTIDNITFPPNITTLDLSDNKIMKFDGSSLEHILHLVINDSDVKYVLKFPPNVITVQMNDNLIKKLPKFPSSLKSLEIINNIVETIPKFTHHMDLLNVSENCVIKKYKFNNVTTYINEDLDDYDYLKQNKYKINKIGGIYLNKLSTRKHYVL